MATYNPFADDAPDFNDEPEFEPQFEEDFLGEEAFTINKPSITQSETIAVKPVVLQSQKSQNQQNTQDIENFDNLDADDLFGDFEDSDEENQPPQSDNQPPPKKARIENNPTNSHPSNSQYNYHSRPISENLPTLNQYEEITPEMRLEAQKKQHMVMRQQIINERARKKQNSVPTVTEDFEFSRTLLAPPISSGFVNIKPSNNGTQYYLRKRMDNDSGFELTTRSKVEDSFYPNFKKLKIEALKSLAKKKVKKQDTQQHYVDTSGELLVSKYAPNHFTSLLSDTGVNRVLLKWLQLWDHCVFGKPKPKKPEEDDDQTNEEKHDSERKSSFGNQKFNKFGPNSGEKTKWGEHKFTPKKPFDPLLEEYDFDKVGRPKHKIILLAGPAGLGKTTLAHVAAKHLGYKVSEINSSDDRSAKTIKETIKKHLSSADVRDGMAEERTGIMHKTKPCCLILDEIDGADSRAIDVVCQLVTSQPKGKGKVKKAGGQKSGSMPVLRRPVIAICNDLYSPSLRQLRQVAIVLHVPQLDKMNMMRRIHEICLTDNVLGKLNIDQTILEYLVERSEKDIRTALNSLQYISQMKNINIGAVMQANIGIKDTTKSLFDIWSQLFKLKHMRNYQKRKALSKSPEKKSENSGKSGAESIKHALRLIRTHSGDSDKILNGLYENYMFSKRTDSDYNSACSANYSLTIYDILSQKIGANQLFILKKYQNYCMVNFHLKFATGAGLGEKRIQYPKLHGDAYRRTLILKDILKQVSKNDKSGKCKDVLVRAPLVSSLVSVIGPERAVAPQMYNDKEKSFVQEQVERLVCTGIHLRQEKLMNSEESTGTFGGYRYIMEPGLNTVSSFPSEQDEIEEKLIDNSGSLKISSNIGYAQAQYLSNIVEREYVERLEKALKSKTRISTNPVNLNKSKNLASPLRKNDKYGLEPPEKLTTPARASTHRLADQMKMLATKSTPKNDEKTSRSGMWKQFLNVQNTPTGDNLEKKRRHTSGKSTNSNAEEYMVHTDPGISNSDVFFRFQHGFCSSVRQRVRAKEFL